MPGGPEPTPEAPAAAFLPPEAFGLAALVPVPGTGPASSTDFWQATSPSRLKGEGEKGQPDASRRTGLPTIHEIKLLSILQRTSERGLGYVRVVQHLPSCHCLLQSVPKSRRVGNFLENMMMTTSLKLSEK